MVTCTALPRPPKDTNYWEALDSVFSPRDIQWLAAERKGACLSLFVSVQHWIGWGAPGGGSLVELAGRIREWLRARGQRTFEVRQLLEPLRQIEGDLSFWRWPGESFAFFSTAHSFRFYRLAFRLPQRFFIGGHFETSPLILNSGLARRYFVLALSRDGARLLECSQRGFRRIRPGPDQQSWHPGGGLRFGDADIEGLLGQFQEVDARLGELFGDNPVPLVLASDPDLASACRSMAAYPGLMEQVVEESPEPSGDLDLQQRAWSAAQPVPVQGFQNALALFEEMSGAQATSTSLKEILSAAVEGRVRHLFVATGPELRGCPERRSAQVSLQGQIQPGERSLSDRCALEVLLKGGKVFAVDSGKVPGGGSLAALFHS